MDKPVDRPLIPVTLLTGFLGSGKTTVLNLVLRAPKMEGTAVIVNEFGEIGIDDALIEMSGSDAVLLSSGCICCTVKDDLTSTMHDLLRQVETGAIPQFHRVVIETTGIADPGPIMQSMMTDPLITPRYRLAGVVTTVDAVNGNRTLDRQHEAVHQAAVADRLLITKTDIAEKPAIDAVLARLKQLNPGAEVIIVQETGFDPGTLFDLGLMKSESKRLDLVTWLNAEGHEAHAHSHGHHHGHDHDHHHDHEHHHDHDHECGPDCEHDHHHHHNDHGIQSFCMIREEPVPWAAFSTWMESISTRRGPDLLRVKGIINIKESPDQPLVVHGVQNVFHPPSLLPAWPTSDRRTRIVFITRDLEKAALEKTLEAFAKDATLIAN